MSKQNNIVNKLKTLERILLLLPGHIYWKDTDGIYLGCNYYQAESLGFESANEIIGKTDYELPWKDQADKLIQIDKTVMATKRPYTAEEFVVLPGGKKSIFLSKKHPLCDENNNVIGILGVSFDITERKQMEKELVLSKEKAEASDKAKSTFIANMSHDIRTPLTGLIGISEMLESKGDSVADRKYGKILHESSESLLLLLNDILEIASAEKIQEDQLASDIFNLPERINQISAIFVPNAELKGLSLRVKLDQNLPIYVETDQIKLDRILLNLIGNSLKFTEKGHVEIKASVISTNINIARIEVTVIDTGIGIPQDKLENIFERFFKVNPSYENKHSGFGIGLYIVKRYVELLNGRVQVISKENEGTTFKVTLPLEIVKAKKVTTTQASNTEELALKKSLVNEVRSLPKTEPIHDHKKVLIIEDDNIARKLAIAAFQAEGFETAEADNAEVGFRRVIQEPYDLIITDIGLPGMDGNQFTSLERSWEKITHHKHLPIVGLSAHGNVKTKESQEAGMDLLLSKPLNKAKIEEIKRKFFSDAVDEMGSSAKEPKSGGLGLDLPNTEVEMFQLEDYSLFDKEEALQNSSNDKNLLKEILVVLVNETINEELDNLDKAHASQDWEGVRKVAHKLKGGAMYCGTIRMRYACQYMERYLLAGHSKLSEDLYEQLKEVLNSTLREVKSYLTSDF